MVHPTRTACLLLLVCLISFISCKTAATKNKEGENLNKSFKPLDIASIERITGLKAIVNNGECKVQIVQNDLSVEADGFRISPAMGLATVVGFTPSPDGAMIMGDIVLTRADVKPVQQEVIRQGFAITAVHNHFVGIHPDIVWMHIGGSGRTEDIAARVKAVFNSVEASRGHDPSKGNQVTVVNTIDTLQLNNLVGYAGRMTNRGVYRFNIDRKVKLSEHGIGLSSFMATGMWFAFQGTNEKAAVSGEYTLLENEVEPVAKALVENGIEVVAVHSHMLHEQPRYFFLHLWGVGPADQLAKGLRAALDKMGAQPKAEDMHGH
jgi:hypothetical protein